MKYVIVILALISLNTYACPDLRGEYPSCAEDTLKDKNGVAIGGVVHDLIIEQENSKEGSVTYSFRTKDGFFGTAVPGKTKTTTKFDRWSRVWIKHEITAKCDKEKLLIHSKIFHNNTIFADTNEVLYKTKDQLIHKISGSSDGKKIENELDCRTYER